VLLEKVDLMAAGPICGDTELIRLLLVVDSSARIFLASGVGAVVLKLVVPALLIIRTTAP
jgi:hypothetical protein